MQSADDWKGTQAMSVTRDRGRWRYRTTAYYADGTTVRITGSAPRYEDTRDKALAMEAEHVKRVRALLPGQEEATEHTIASVPAEPAKPFVPSIQEFLAVYLDSMRLDAKPSTIITTESDFRTHIVPKLGHLRLDEVTYAAIEDFKLALTKTQDANAKRRPRFLRPRSIHNLLVHVSGMLGVAKKRGLIATLPEIAWIKIPPAEFDFLDFDEANRLVAAADGEWRTMILVALRTGMRMGELLGLRWVDVDLSAGRIHVRQSYVKGHCGLPKSGKPREIPLGDDVIEVLRAHRHERGPLVFCDVVGNVLTAGLLGWPVKRAVKRAGLRAIGWHVLRHTFASHLVMRGVQLKAHPRAARARIDRDHHDLRPPRAARGARCGDPARAAALRVASSRRPDGQPVNRRAQALGRIYGLHAVPRWVRAPRAGSRAGTPAARLEPRTARHLHSMASGSTKGSDDHLHDLREREV
jgi:integrase